jgi:sucrose-6-phosphate hydrolase SacC (GH32 family)
MAEPSSRRAGTRRVLAGGCALAAMLLCAPGAAGAAAVSSEVVNGDFETGTLSGWTTTGNTFQGAVTSETGYGWGCCFGQHGTYHAWGFKTAHDDATGTLTSSVFRLAGGGRVSFLVGGGDDLGRLYVAVVRASDGAVLFKATGTGSEAYRRVDWDGSAHAGEDLRIQAVDTATGGWGHINLDDVRTSTDAQTSAADSVIADWPFDEGRGASVRDIRGGVSDPIGYVFLNARYKPSTDPLWHVGAAGEGVLSRALLFDGYSTWVTRRGFVAPTDGITVEAWVAPRAFEWGDEGRLSAIVNQHDREAAQGFILGVGRHGAWSFQAGVGGAWQQVWSPPGAALQRGRWAHVAATFSATGRSMALYLNGRLVATRATPPGGIAPFRGDLLIGRNNQSVLINGTFPVNMFSGDIDELKIRSRALTGAEVAATYQADLQTFANGAVPAADVAMKRSRYAGDRYRPQYHFIAPEHWMNEPNGPIYVNGQYHLFYQQNQHGPYWHNMSWGHAVSPDAVHWRDLPTALVPTAGSVAPDGVWSGGAALDAAGRPLLFFTAGDDSTFPNQRTGVAGCATDPCSRDLVDWTMEPAPVTVQRRDLDVGPGRMVRYGEFRDPFVWREGSRWFQLVGSGVQTTGGADVGGTALLYTSTDHRNWSYAGPLMTGDIGAHPATGQIWELPVFLPITDAQGRRKHVLLVNPAWKGDSPFISRYIWYWVGDWDPATGRFTPDSRVPRQFDYGEHFTGPSGFVDPKGRSLVFSIAQDRRTEQAHYDAGWAHNAGLPIALSLRPDGDLGVAPIAELSSLHKTADPLVAITGTTSIGDATQRLAGVRGDMLHISLQLAANGANRYGIKLRRSPGGEEETLVSYDRSSQTLSIDRGRSGSVSSLTPDLGVQGGPLALGGADLKLDIYLDKSMVEVYANGYKSLTSRVYPSRDDALGLALWADGPAQVKSLRVWEMQSAYGS